MNNHLVYVDCESTQLDTRLADIIEAAWAVEDNPVTVIRFDHSLLHADPAALRINRYFERDLDRHNSDGRGVTDLHRQLIRDLYGSTIVAENYGFDCALLMRKLGFEPWHYRKIELSSVAMTVFDLDRPEGLDKTATRLRDRGHTIPDNDHTAAADVECLRACYTALRAERTTETGPRP